jgi:hypothetical protein
MGRKSRKLKSEAIEKEKNTSGKSGIRKEIIVGFVVAFFTLIATKACDGIGTYLAKGEEIDEKLDDLYTAIVFEHGKPKDELEKLSGDRLQKLKIIQKIQKRIHAKRFSTLEKIVPSLSEDSNNSDWDKAINAHTQIERQEHKNFAIAEAKAFWQKSLKIAQHEKTNPMAKTVLYTERPAVDLAISKSNLKIDLASFDDKKIQGVVLKSKEIKYVPISYPVISNDDGKTIFIPDINSLDSLNYFEGAKGETGGGAKAEATSEEVFP